MRCIVLFWLLFDIVVSQDVGDPFSNTDAGSNDETSAPDTTALTTTTPETSTPETTSPETTSPETSTPETSTPETSTPETSAPETSAPETSAPETTAPETTAPETSTPETTAPVVTTKTPVTTTPGTTTPATTTSTPTTTAPTVTTTAPSPPTATTSTPASTTATPVVKYYNSSTLPPGVDSSMLNGTELQTVEVTETTDADGTTSYSYIIVTTSGNTETKIVWTPTATSSTSNGDGSAVAQPGSSLSDTNSYGKKSSGIGAGALIGIIAGAMVFMVVVFAFLVAQRQKNKRRRSNTTSDGVIVLPAVGKQERLLENGMLPDAEYQDISKTAVNSRSSGDSRRYHSTLWEDPVITAARIPVDHVEMGAIISRGAFGEVHRGLYRGQDVAIKTLLPEKRKDLQYIQAFLSEVRLMATMEHPYIVQFIGVAWESLSDLYCVSEFMAGGDLRSLLKDYLATGVPQGMDATKMQITYHVAYALTYLHSLEPVVLHRDLKSRNILLTPSLDAKITDFGASRIRSDATMTAGVGSSLWMAPEVMMGNRYDEKADVFSLGVVMSELDTHELPYSHAKESNVDSSNSGSRPLPDAAVLQMVSTGKLRVYFSHYMNSDMARFARSCVEVDPRMRPTAAEVLYYLQVAIRNQQY